MNIYHMKNICSKIKFSYTFVLVIFLSLISGLFWEIFSLFTIIIVHELGHIIMSVKYKWRIKKIDITMCGGFITYDDVILKNNLLYNKEIDNDKLNELYKDNTYYDTYNKVVKMISKRLRSEKEINDYLEKNNVIDKDKIISRLKSVNLINDTNFAKAYLYDRLYLSKDGVSKIQSDLIDYGINDNIISDLLSNLDEAIIDEKLEKIVIKKIKSNSNKSNYLLKQKIIYDLINLGYDKEKIVYYFDKNITDDSSAILKEYNKLFKKLSLKYSDDKLKCEIKNKLFQKGYSSYEIDKIINEKSN